MQGSEIEVRQVRISDLKVILLKEETHLDAKQRIDKDVVYYVGVDIKGCLLKAGHCRVFNHIEPTGIYSVYDAAKGDLLASKRDEHVIMIIMLKLRFGIYKELHKYVILNILLTPVGTPDG